jgi:hypothetical protein
LNEKRQITSLNDENRCFFTKTDEAKRQMSSRTRHSTKTKKQPPKRAVSSHLPGDVLLSQGEIPQLPSALKSLTSVFGMGTGVTSSP